jgi:site-specific recombinase XerD
MLSNEDLLARFAEEHYERNSISEGRRHQSDVVLRALAARLKGRPLMEVTPSDLMAWQGAELKRGLAPNTVQKEQNMISAFITWAGRAQLISFEVTTQLKSVGAPRGATTTQQPRPYKKHELQLFRQLLAAKYPTMPDVGRGSLMMRRYLGGHSQFRWVIKKHARRLQYEAQVSLALEEGLRRIEIYRLPMVDLHYENASVVVRTAKGRPGQVREREVPYAGHSRLCVQEWLDFRDLLAPGHEHPWLTLDNTDPSSPQTLRRFAASLDRFKGPWSWHRFRHTFATERLRAGVPLEQVQRMLGHARMEQTLAYAEIVSADVEREALRTEDQFARNLGLEAA